MSILENSLSKLDQIKFEFPRWTRRLEGEEEVEVDSAGPGGTGSAQRDNPIPPEEQWIILMRIQIRIRIL